MHCSCALLVLFMLLCPSQQILKNAVKKERGPQSQQHVGAEREGRGWDASEVYTFECEVEWDRGRLCLGRSCPPQNMLREAQEARLPLVPGPRRERHACCMRGNTRKEQFARPCVGRGWRAALQHIRGKHVDAEFGWELR